jgi:hypothetical protein
MTSGPPGDERDLGGRRDPDGPRTPDPTDHEQMAAHDEHTPDSHGKPAGPPGPGETTGAPGDGLRATLGLPRISVVPEDSEGPEEMSSAEEVLRHLLHDSVRDIAPSSGTLEHLRRAIPARRAHRRQAMVGAAASLLLAVAAVPALIHTAGTSNDSAAPASHVSAHHRPQGGEKGHGSRGGHSKGSAHGGTSTHPGGKGRHKNPGSQGQPGVATAGPSTAPTGGVFGTHDTPCAAAQLSGATAVGAPDGDGDVYGTFTISNTSTSGCAISGAGTVTAAAQGNADPAHVTASAHTAGDPATGLPAGGSTDFVLAPGQSFQVKFGWIPASGTTGCTASGQPTSDGGTGDGGGQSANTPDSDPTDAAPPGSVTVTYTSAPGATASGTVQNVCAGTVYYTPPLTAGQP